MTVAASEPASVSSQTQGEEQPPLKGTPLPKLQLFIAILFHTSEAVTSTVIYPFVNDLIRALGITGGDEKKTGYYVGVIVRFAQFC